MATNTSDMNTPEHATKNNNINENKQQYTNKLQPRLVPNQARRIQGRDYGRILREYNTPAQWYNASPITRSVYYYDTNYQKYLQQQQSKSTTNLRPIPSPIRVTNQSKSRTKYTTNMHNCSNNHHQQKPILPSRLQSVPTLPPIIIHKNPHDK